MSRTAIVVGAAALTVGAAVLLPVPAQSSAAVFRGDGSSIQHHVIRPLVLETRAAAAEFRPRSPAQGLDVPPYSGTMWVSPDVLTPADPSDLEEIEYAGIQQRQTFDRRVDGWVRGPAHVFWAHYNCGLPVVEVIVNVEFDREAASVQAQRFAEVHGRLPPGLRLAVYEIWIHAGDELAGGGNKSVLIHTEWDGLQQWSFVEELFLHEVAHTTLDYEGHGAGAVDRASWETAKAQDTRAISDYARDFPAREDVAESYVAFALWKVAGAANPYDRDAQTIASTIPNRLAYLESLGDEFLPRTDACPSITPAPVSNLKATTRGRFTTISWTPPQPSYSISHYEWRVAARVNALGDWQTVGDAKSSSFVLRNQSLGRNWFVEVRPMWGSEPGPAMRVRYRS